jgi:hypothetical protein
MSLGYKTVSGNIGITGRIGTCTKDKGLFHFNVDNL